MLLSTFDAHSAADGTTGKTRKRAERRRTYTTAFFIEAKLDGTIIDALVDTGASISVIDETLLTADHKKAVKPTTPPKVVSCTGAQLRLTGTIDLLVTIADRNVLVEAYVGRGVTKCLILGMDFLSTHACSLDIRRRRLKLDQRRTKPAGSGNDRLVCSAVPKRDWSPWIQHLAGAERQAMARLFDEFADVFAADKDDLGETSLVEHYIPTGNARPIRSRPYRVPQALKAEVERQIEHQLRLGVIEKSKSPWAAPVVMHPKTDDHSEWRFCINFKGLNGVTHKDAYPLPRIDETLEALHGSTIFSTLDLASGYWQVRVAKIDREKTAFITPSGLYQYIRMPFGVTGGPATFQRLMERVIEPVHGKCAYVYLDDIVVHSKSFEQHLHDLRRVFERLREAGLKMGPAKCAFAAAETRYLGHVISDRGIETNPRLTDKVARYPVPRTKRDVRAFLGLAGYYRRFIRDFAKTAAPLSSLTSAIATFLWEAVQHVQNGMSVQL